MLTKKQTQIIFFILIAIGLLLRFILMPHHGFEADIAYWKGWGLAMFDKGILWLVKNTNYNYPPGFAYILWLVHGAYSLFGNPKDVATFWLNSNVLYLVIFKFITIVFDLGIVMLILQFGTIFKKKTLSYVFALLYFLSPAVLFDGVVWGQVDQLGLFMLLLVIFLLMKDRFILASLIFAVGCLLKFQNIIFIPLLYLYIYKKYSFESCIKSLAVSFAVFTVISLPFFIYHEVEVLMRLLTINADWFPFYSLNAFNFWWILSGLQGMELSDKQLIVGVVNAKQLGFYMFVAVYLLCCSMVYFSQKGTRLRTLVIVCTLATLAFFHLLTQSHERYQFHLLGLLPLIALMETSQRAWRTLLFTVIFSLLFFLNMYIAFFFNYPQLLVWPFTQAMSRSLSLPLSLLLIAMAVYFFIFYCLRRDKKSAVVLVAGLVTVITLVGFKNVSYLMGRPIALSSLVAIETKQDYLKPVANKTVNSDLGPLHWNRLSANYFFYDKGIGSHANSTLTYHLGKRFSKFNTDIAVDTEGSEEASVVFSVIGDGKELFRSKTKGRFDNPSTVRLSVKGVETLALKIQSTDNDIRGDHADWLNPMLIR